MPNVRVIHGPNLNMLGVREPEVYGRTTLEDLNSQLEARARELGLGIEITQSNCEGEIVTQIQSCRSRFDVLILNPGGLTHTSVCVRDAIAACGVPTIECHISNIYGREEFRRHSLTADVCAGQISGFGTDSYLIALDAAARVCGRGRA